MGDPGRASLRAAAAGGLVSGLAVVAIFLAAGAFEDEQPPAQPAQPSATTTTATLSPGEIYRRARLGVVLVDHRPPGVRPRRGPPRRDDGIATGSGFVIDRQGHVVTNQHIVVGRGTTTVQFTAGAEPVRARIVGRDASTDLALLRVDPDRARRLVALPLGASDAVRVGETAIAIGNPLGLQRSLTVGVVSATGRRIGAPNGGRIRNAVQTDAPINPGNSGGPLLDSHGRVIGVISQARGPGIGFAVPVDTVKRVVARLQRRAG